MAKDGIGSLVSLGLLGGAAWIAGGFFKLWALPSWLGGSASAGPGATAVGSTGASSGAAASNAAPSSNAPPSIAWPSGDSVAIMPGGTRALMLNQLVVDAANGGVTGNLTFDGWNYFYQKRAGNYLQAQPGLDTRTAQISLMQFLSQLPDVPMTPNTPGLAGWAGGYLPKRSILQRAPMPLGGGGYVPKRRNMGVINSANWRPAGT